MRVLIAAGGTAGHINPALAIAGALRAADPRTEIHFAGRQEGMEYRLVTQAGYPFHHIEVTGFQRRPSLENLRRNAVTVWNLARSGPRCRAILREVEPDLVIGWVSWNNEGLGSVEFFQDNGCNVMSFNSMTNSSFRNLESMKTDYDNIGRIFDVEEKAQALVDEMQAQVADTLAAAEGHDPVRVAVVEPISGTITNYGADTLAGDMVTALGGELAKPEGSDMGKEDLVACDPDVIFVVYMAYSGDDPESVMTQQLSLIQDDPAFASLSAVQSGNIHLIMLGDMYASGPRTIDGLRTLAQGMYPDLEL